MRFPPAACSPWTRPSSALVPATAAPAVDTYRLEFCHAAAYRSVEGSRWSRSRSGLRAERVLS
jgi:hypothetical protein